MRVGLRATGRSKRAVGYFTATRRWSHGRGLGAMASDARTGDYRAGSRLGDLSQVQLAQAFIDLREGLCKRVWDGTWSLRSFGEPYAPFGVMEVLVLVPAKFRVHVFRIAVCEEDATRLSAGRVS